MQLSDSEWVMIARCIHFTAKTLGSLDGDALGTDVAAQAFVEPIVTSMWRLLTKIGENGELACHGGVEGKFLPDIDRLAATLRLAKYELRQHPTKATSSAEGAVTELLEVIKRKRKI